MIYNMHSPPTVAGEEQELLHVTGWSQAVARLALKRQRTDKNTVPQVGQLSSWR